jgi:hypothetical protein
MISNGNRSFFGRRQWPVTLCFERPSSEALKLPPLRAVKHAHYYWLLQAQSHLTRRLFGGMMRQIAALPVPTG